MFIPAHHDNRDFDVVPDYQPQGQSSFNEQTHMLNSSPGVSYILTTLDKYNYEQSSLCSLDGFWHTSGSTSASSKWPVISMTQWKRNSSSATGLKSSKCLSTSYLYENDYQCAKMMNWKRYSAFLFVIFKEHPSTFHDCLCKLTDDEKLFYEFAMALCDWLLPYHDFARPPPAIVLAEANKQTELLKSGKAGKVTGNGHSTQSNGHKKGNEEPPPVKDAPETVVKFFSGMYAPLTRHYV